MKEFVGELFFHFFIMMIIPLVYNLLFKQSRKSKTNTIFFLIICISLTLSMLFPVRIVDGVEFDFKFIPVFIAFFYIGNVAGLLMIVVLLVLKIFLNADEFLLSFINYSVIYVLFIMIKKLFHKGKMLFKLLVGFIFYLFIYGTRTFILMQSENVNDLYYLLWFSLVSIASLSTTIYLIEMSKLQYLMLEQLKKADKSNAISQLAASIAHEIRNPMTTIRGFMQLMKSEKNLTSNQQMFITLSLDELDRTHRIINDFLALARPANHLDECVSLSDTLADVADFMRPYALITNVNLLTDIESNLVISGNANECKQLFINIIKNGIEAMPTGGDLKIIAQKQDSHAVIEIIDCGIGLSSLQLQQLGQPYYSTKTKGTGLGLMICFDIIKRMKGDYHIESEENKGTTFKILFPL